MDGNGGRNGGGNGGGNGGSGNGAQPLRFPALVRRSLC